MSSNTELNFNGNSNYWVNWINESIANKQIKCYDYKHFNNIQEIGFGSFGKVYRVNLKNSHGYLALKSFFNFNNMAKEIANEFKLQREVDFHENIIRFYGITTEIQSDNSKKYLLVMEYAGSGTLRNYLSEHFEILTWNNKLNLALQLANAISCLHDKEIVHHDLNSNNVLVHKNTIKLTCFGLSKRVEESYNIQSKLYTNADPQTFSHLQLYSLNKKSNVYSIGLLLWEISSGRPPFCDEPYDVGLAMEILQGEKPIPNTPDDYVKIYCGCLNNEPDNRPTINQVVAKLNAIISDFQQNYYNSDIQLSRKQVFRLNNDNSLNEKMSQVDQNFSRNNIKEIEPLISNLITNNFNLVVNNIIPILENTDVKMRKSAIVNYLNNHNIDLQEIYYWLLECQDNSSSVFLLGLFNHFGIETNVDKQKAYELYQMAADSENLLGITSLAHCYINGIGTSINKQKAFDLFKRASNLGSAIGTFNLGNCYREGIGTIINKQKSFELFQKAANLGNTPGMTNLGNCYFCGFGIDVDKQKAFELYQKAANLENYLAQYNLASMYESGKDVKKDINHAIYLYKKSAKQGFQKAQNKFDELINLEN
ncbi:kinase-like domain-containing protein [Rhizophagus diaphanus]|nr:kinase-like domain-containing protein [Rhizophagus diaphanus] [Rhizophagus sp. MUCL 43196]